MPMITFAQVSARASTAAALVGSRTCVGRVADARERERGDRAGRRHRRLGHRRLPAALEVGDPAEQLQHHPVDREPERPRHQGVGELVDQRGQAQQHREHEGQDPRAPRALDREGRDPQVGQERRPRGSRSGGSRRGSRRYGSSGWPPLHRRRATVEAPTNRTHGPPRRRPYRERRAAAATHAGPAAPRRPYARRPSRPVGRNRPLATGSASHPTIRFPNSGSRSRKRKRLRAGAVVRGHRDGRDGRWRGSAEDTAAGAWCHASGVGPPT